MTPEHIKQLVMDYPHLFPLGADEGVISCGDGWFDLVYQLCGEIMNFLHKLFPKPTAGLAIFEVAQVKEKFGYLRFYTHGYENADITLAIMKTEEISGTICELTGEPGSLHEKNGWLKTLSDRKAQGLGYRKVDTAKGQPWISLSAISKE